MRVIALLLSTAASVAATIESLRAYDIPSFDYNAMHQAADVPAHMLAALQHDGIIALKNVPHYGQTRERYLSVAAACAVNTMEDPTATFLSKKAFFDGTKRYTISTNAGHELRGSAAETRDRCPEYQSQYEAFSGIVEHAVNGFGAALDKTSFTASDGHKPISSRKLISEAVRLDHFHAYEPARQSTARELELSLPLHEDHGLFIAMTAPKFFHFDSNDHRSLQEQSVAHDASGLVIQTASGEKVRPVIKDDELVIMMGTGASRWLKTSHQIPAVMHGMKMPRAMMVDDGERRALRAWFGKMTLLPAYQRMLQNQNLVFGQHLNTTTRYLMENQEHDLQTIGCATGRRLQPSDKTCTKRICKTKPGKEDPAEGCQTICNRKGHDPQDEPTCEEKCACSNSPNPAALCWMLCVENLPTSECALENQTCKDQSIVCKAPAPGPAPTAGPGPAPSPTKTSAPAPGPTSAPAVPTSTPPTNAPTPGSSTSPFPATIPANDTGNGTNPMAPVPSPSSATSSFSSSASSLSGSGSNTAIEPPTASKDSVMTDAPAKPKTSAPTPSATSAATTVQVSAVTLVSIGVSFLL